MTDSEFEEITSSPKNLSKYLRSIPEEERLILEQSVENTEDLVISILKNSILNKDQKHMYLKIINNMFALADIAYYFKRM